MPRTAVVAEAGGTGDVLVERAAERDVAHLVAATDRQGRYAEPDGGADQGDLAGVPTGVDAVDAGGRRLAVGGGVEVAAAEQQQPVEAGEESRRLGVGPRRRLEDRLASAHGAQGVDVAQGDPETTVVPALHPVRRQARVRRDRHERGDVRRRHQNCTKLRRRSQSVTTEANAAHSWRATLTRCSCTSAPNAVAARSLAAKASVASTMFHGTRGIVVAS